MFGSSIEARSPTAPQGSFCQDTTVSVPVTLIILAAWEEVLNEVTLIAKQSPEFRRSAVEPSLDRTAEAAVPTRPRVVTKS